MAFLTLAFGLGRQARGLSSSIYNTACPAEHMGIIGISTNQLLQKKKLFLLHIPFLAGKMVLKCVL